MPFHWQTFKTRTLSAIVFVALMLSGLLLNHWTFLLLCIVIHTGCWLEYQKLVARIYPEYRQVTPFHRYGMLLAGTAFLLWMTSSLYNFGQLNLHEIGWWLLLVLLLILPVAETLFSAQLDLRSIGYSFAGLVYISMSLGFLVNIRTGQAHITDFNNVSTRLTGLHLVMAVIGTNWINDTMAYLVGSFIGKTPFSRISPKKTWEGTLGGFILAVVAGGFLFSGLHAFHFLPGRPVIDPVHWFVLVALGAAAGTVGDLFESKIKRMAGVKDSGNLMPGHGGYLDRFDSLLFAAPVCWLYLQLFVFA